VTTCPECQGAGFVVGDESASRVRCLGCGGSGLRAATDEDPRARAVVSSAADARSTSAVALADDPQPAR
jgi:hypothetical protein